MLNKLFTSQKEINKKLCLFAIPLSLKFVQNLLTFPLLGSLQKLRETLLNLKPVFVQEFIAPIFFDQIIKENNCIILL